MFAHGLDWPTWLLVLALVVSVITFMFWRSLGLLLAAAVLIAGLNWNLPTWFLVIFWIAWFLVLLAQFAWEWVQWLAAALVFVLVAALGVQTISLFFRGGHGTSTVAPSPSGTSTPGTGAETPKPKATAACPTTWEIKYHDRGDSNRWLASGLASIQDAKTKANAAEAAQDWVNHVVVDPILLKGAVALFLKKDVSLASLKDGKCISPDGKALATQLEIYMATADITPGDAPATATNTGVEGGRVVASAQPGIDGNLKSIRVASGSTVHWVLARCANVVTVKVPVIVVRGKTDQIRIVVPGLTVIQTVPGPTTTTTVVVPPPSTPPSTSTPPPTTTTTTTPPPSTTPPCVKPPKPGTGEYKYDEKTCTWHKPSQSEDCKLNGGKDCSPNGAPNPPQSNSGQPTGVSPGAPSSPSTQRPTSSAPAGGSTGPGGSTGGSQPTNDPVTGITGTVTPPAPTRPGGA